MKVGYCETRRKSKHFTYITYFNLIHGLLVIKCMIPKVFFAKLETLEKNRKFGEPKKTLLG